MKLQLLLKYMLLFCTLGVALIDLEINDSPRLVSRPIPRGAPQRSTHSHAEHREARRYPLERPPPERPAQSPAQCAQRIPQKVTSSMLGVPRIRNPARVPTRIPGEPTCHRPGAENP